MSEEARLPNTGEVFVPGGMPRFTYQPRSSLGLETRLNDALQQGHRILSLSGPTKSGKTVLLKGVIRNGLWIPGGEITSVDDFYAKVVESLALATTYATEATEEGEQTSTRTGSGSVSLWGTGGNLERTKSQTDRTSRTSTTGTQVTDATAAMRGLAETSHTLVIDDFHYLNGEVQLAIVRALKSLIFDGLRVVVAAVPHRRFDASRVEREMTGRIEQIEIPPWQNGELRGIARDGFNVLKVADDGSLATILAKESFGSPHIMQDLCLNLCLTNGVRDTQDSSVTLAAPTDWRPFFKGRARSASKDVYDRMARGPRQRRDRKPRVRSDNITTDIYGIVLAAIASSLPRMAITYEELRTSLRNVSKSEVPNKADVVRVLLAMTQLSRDDEAGEPVLDYDSTNEVLHIVDPYFAYFLKWGFLDEYLYKRLV